MAFKKRQWSILNEFERKEKEVFLKKLTVNKSLKMLNALYRFARNFTDKQYYRRLDPEKIKALSRVHNLFMAVKP